MASFQDDPYADGSELTLLLHAKITPAYGPSHFPWPWRSVPGIETPVPFTPKTYPSGFDPDGAVHANERLRIAVVETLSGGSERGPQVLLCTVLEAPSKPSNHHALLTVGMNIVIKVFDYDYYPQRVTFPWRYLPYQVADQDFSREASALRFMHRTGRSEDGSEPPGVLRLTGAHRLAPEYYGAWAIDLSTKDGTRYVGAVAMEHIDGVSMEDLCTRKGDSFRLYPKTEPQALYDADEDETHGYLDMGVRTRLRLFGDILEGFVDGYKCGVKHEEYELGDFMITYLSHGKQLQRPRVVKLSYKFCRVWPMTVMARCGAKPETDNELLEFPVHPADHFTLRELIDFCGWWPYEWWHDESQFYAWLLRAFGPKEEAVPLHMYSVYATLEAERRKSAAEALPYSNEDVVPYSNERGTIDSTQALVIADRAKNALLDKVPRRLEECKLLMMGLHPSMRPRIGTLQFVIGYEILGAHQVLIARFVNDAWVRLKPRLFKKTAAEVESRLGHELEVAGLQAIDNYFHERYYRTVYGGSSQRAIDGELMPRVMETMKGEIIPGISSRLREAVEKFGISPSEGSKMHDINLGKARAIVEHHVDIGLQRLRRASWFPAWRKTHFFVDMERKLCSKREVNRIKRVVQRFLAECYKEMKETQRLQRLDTMVDAFGDMRLYDPTAEEKLSEEGSEYSEYSEDDDEDSEDDDEDSEDDDEDSEDDDEYSDEDEDDGGGNDYQDDNDQDDHSRGDRGDNVNSDEAKDGEAKDDKAKDEGKKGERKNDESKASKPKVSKPKASPYVPNYLKPTTASTAKSKPRTR